VWALTASDTAANKQKDRPAAVSVQLESGYF
jgi:hypothetical protein